MLKKRLIAAASIAIIVGSLFMGCSSRDAATSKKGKNTTVAVSGSTSVGPLVEVEGEEFEANNQDVVIEINQTGSSSGIKDTLDGVSEIGMTSRELTNEEAKNLNEVTIAIDGIGVVVNKNNPVKDLTLEQIKDIFTGKITNWKEVGGKDKEIVVVSREEGSGTRTAFEEILGYSTKETAKKAIVNNATGSIKVTVEGNENAIGYMSIGYIDNSISSVKVDGIEANAENIKSGKYKIQRPFLLVYKDGNLSQEGHKFIDFILSDKGQAIVEEDKLITVN